MGPVRPTVDAAAPTVSLPGLRACGGFDGLTVRCADGAIPRVRLLAKLGEGRTAPVERRHRAYTVANPRLPDRPAPPSRALRRGCAYDGCFTVIFGGVPTIARYDARDLASNIGWPIRHS